MLDHNNPNLKLNYLADLSDIPEELKKHLSILKPIGIAEDHFIEALTYFGGTASLDEMIVYAYRRYKTVYKRPYCHTIMGELRKKGLMESVEGRKGVYRLLQTEAPQPETPQEDILPEQPQEQEQEQEQEPQEAKKKEPTELDKVYLEAIKRLGGMGSYEDIFKFISKKHKTTKHALAQTMLRLHKKGFVERVDAGVYALREER